MGRGGLGLGLHGVHLVQLDEPVPRTGHDQFLVGGQRTHCSVVTHQSTNVGEPCRTDGEEGEEDRGERDIDRITKYKPRKKWLVP